MIALPVETRLPRNSDSADSARKAGRSFDGGEPAVIACEQRRWARGGRSGLRLDSIRRGLVASWIGVICLVGMAAPASVWGQQAGSGPEPVAAGAPSSPDSTEARPSDSTESEASAPGEKKTKSEPERVGPSSAGPPIPSDAVGPILVAGVAVVAVLPFQINSAKSLQYLSESLPQLLSARLVGTGKVATVDPEQVKEALAKIDALEPSDAQLRALARELEAQGVVAASVTELAGRYSLDARFVPADKTSRGRSLSWSAGSERELVTRLGDLTEQVVAIVSGADPDRVISLQVVGAGDRGESIRRSVTSQAGAAYDPDQVEADRAAIESGDGIARVSVSTERRAGGVLLTFNVVRADAIVGTGAGGAARSGQVVADIRIRGNRRIEQDAIRSRIRTKAGEPLNRGKLAKDVQEVYALGFFRNVYVYAEESPEGLTVTFEVEENPVIRQISIIGNDSVDGDDIRDILTLTTGSTLDYPLLHENEERISALYRQKGYYLAEVSFSISEESQGSVSVDFDVDEGEKLKLRSIQFRGNAAFSNKELLRSFSTKKWRWYSFATSWFDQTGTYSEPLFARDLREVEKKYTDDGYLQVEVSQPLVDATEEGLFVTIDIKEGPQFRVGEIEVSGDQTMDLDALRERVRLNQGDVFNRSYLTADVEALERHYTDRGFFLATVQPLTRLDSQTKTVDVQFDVQKGPLYFVRTINISGNTRTIDPVIRREMQVVEGQLYSARGIQISTQRIRRLGFFEDISFDSKPTDDPSQLDLGVNVVERPTGSFSFGAGFSSQDGLVFTASLAQSNLFGRGYFVNLSIDVGGSTNRYVASLSDPYFLGSQFSLAGSIFVTDVQFESFRQYQQGINFSLGHSLAEDNSARGALNYTYRSREVQQDTGIFAASPIIREVLQGNESASILGVSYTRDTRDDRFTAISGTNFGANIEYAGLGGFARFLRFEARGAWYMGAPDFLFDRSTFVLSTRIGYAIPFNQLSDWSLNLPETTACDVPGSCVNVGQLNQIDTDLRLPLTERYFLGGIGTFQLRGYRARSVGPRRSILRPSEPLLGQPAGLFYPVGTELERDATNNRWVAVCQDTGPNATGNGNGRCNNLNDKNVDQFGDVFETDVVGGNSFISSSFEYRFPISESVGLQGVLFVDAGNAFYEGENLFDVTNWRYGYGGGVLWFSPFGPLQLVLGFPVDPEVFEQSPVFEFSVGGFGL
ncbi:MAG: outer membrane protein assembly factor BamA [Deltaproteobacteria bacterium]|nr:outer membrane protein assembly factor BamA [Deltaproteobacteria bacterium]